MLLYDQHEAGHILNGLHAAAAKVYAEEFGTWHRFTRQIDNTTTFLILAVSLDIQYAVETGLGYMDLHLYSISQATDNHIGAWEVRTEVGVIAVQLGITRVAGDALALGTMVHSITEGIHTTRLGQAGILAGLCFRIAEAIVRTLFIGDAFGLLNGHAFTQWCQTIAQVNGTCTATTFIDYHAALQGAHAMAAFIDSIALFHQARCAVLVDVESAARWAHALAIDIAHKALLDDTQRALVALHGCIARVALEAFTDHSAYRQRIEDAAFGIHAARLRRIAGIHTFASQTGALSWAVAIAGANGHDSFLLAAIASGQSAGRAGALRPMLINLAELVVGANGSGLAWIGALAVDTGLVGWALVVVAAAKRCAAQTRVSAMSRSTLTHGPMIYGQAFGIGSALLALAGGYAELITACVCCWALGIDGAFDFGALEFGIALVALATGAHWLVILDATLGVHSAIAWITANAAHARLVGRTVGVGDAAAYFHDASGGLAATAATADVTIWTDADHGAYRCRRGHLTLGRSLTRLQYQAGVDALFVDAGQTSRTVRIQFAHRLGLRATVHIGIANEI